MTQRSLRRLNCPRCGSKTQWDGNPSRPFCSERCRAIELGQWLDASYRIAAENQGSLDGSPEDGEQA